MDCINVLSVTLHFETLKLPNVIYHTCVDDNRPLFVLHRALVLSQLDDVSLSGHAGGASNIGGDVCLLLRMVCLPGYDGLEQVWIGCELRVYDLLLRRFHYGRDQSIVVHC